MAVIVYQTAAWNTHSQVNLREIEYPLFEGEPTHFTVRRTYEGPSTTYATAALDTADTEFAAAKLVGQGPLRDADGGQVRYERTFATVPASWSEPESYAYAFPGVAVGTAGAGVSVSSIVVSGVNQVAIGSALTGVAVGDQVYASLKYTRGGVVYFQGFNGRASAVSSGVSVTLPGNLLGGVGSASAVSGSIQKAGLGRTFPKTMTVGGRVVHDYALSSIAALDTDLPLFDNFAPVLTSTGEQTDQLTTGTSPTAAEYWLLVVNDTEIVVECTRSRYLGNIFVRKTRLIPAR